MVVGGGCFVVEMEGDGWEVAVGWRIDGREGGGRCRSRSWRRTEIGESVEVESVQSRRLGRFARKEATTKYGLVSEEVVDLW